MTPSDKDRDRATDLLEIMLSGTKASALDASQLREPISEKLAEWRAEDQQKPETTFVTNDKVGSVSQ